jgi:hypothetical protein
MTNLKYSSFLRQESRFDTIDVISHRDVIKRCELSIYFISEKFIVICVDVHESIFINNSVFN